MKKENFHPQNLALTLTNKLAVLFITAMLIFTAATSHAQQLTTRPEQGLGSSGGYQTTNVDSISLQNGAVNLSIPLASLPPIAGGKLSYTLIASYNGKLWKTDQQEVWHYPTVIQPGVPFCPGSYSTQTLAQAEGSGWQIGGQYQVFYRDAHEDYAYLAPNNDTCWSAGEFNAMQGRYFKPMLRMPDGSEHDLRFQSYVEQYPAWGVTEHMKGFYKQPGSGGPGQPAFSTPVRMYTVDGTFIAVEVDQASSISAKIVLKDGTRIELSNDGQRTIDTNGNSILQGFRTVNGVFEQFVKDEQTGREIKWMGATYNGQAATKVQYQSVGGTWQDVYVVYGTTTLKGKVYGKTGWNPSGGEFSNGDICYYHEYVPDTDLPVIRQIVYPATESGVSPQTFAFGYNSDETQQTSDTFMDCGLQSQTYSRTASKGWGEISDVTTPAGAHIKYEYAYDGTHTFSQSSPYDASDVVKNTILKKKTTHDGETDEWTYTISPGLSQSASGGSVVNPDGSSHSELYNPVDIAYSGRGGNDGMGGLLIKSTDNGGRILIEKKWMTLGGFVPTIGAPTQWVGVNRVIDTEFTTIRDDQGNRLKMTAKKFQYDYNGNITQTIQYGWVNLANVTYTNSNSYTSMPTDVPSGTPVLKITNMSYYNLAGDASSPNAYKTRDLSPSVVILGLLKETTVGNGTTTKSTTEFYYDGHSDQSAAPTKGNLTKSSSWDDAGNQWVTTQSSFSSHGNVLTQTDAKGGVTQYSYGAINGVTDLYPTQIVIGYGTSIARTTAYVYDFYTGKVTTTTDVDNSLSVSMEYDVLGRPTKVKNAVASPIESWVTREYSDFNRRIITRSDLESMGDGKKVAIEHYDELGRLRLKRTLENAAVEDPYNENSGIKVETRYKNSSPYSYEVTSNPFRADTAADAGGEATMGWTLTKTWGNGSREETETFSGAALPAAFVTSGGNTNTTGKTYTESYAEKTLIADQAGKQRISATDALGRITEVWEITAQDAATTSVTFPNHSEVAYGYQTSYSYDLLGNLASVTQGGQTARSYTYSSLSRLTMAFNPETGTISYAYDPNGNLVTRSQVRSGTANVVVSMTYDGLNRILQRSYSTPNGTPSNYQNTPTVNYTYDDKAHARGRLTKVSSSASTTEFTEFDVMGRVAGHKQTTDSRDYETHYLYDLTGTLLEETYPSGRKVKNISDSNGNLSRVESKKNSSAGYWAYADNFTYSAAGSVISMQLGNGHWENTVLNARLQPARIGLGVTPGASSIFQLDYNYGSSQNNGNVQSQSITVPTVGGSSGFTAIQNYTYDSLNRLQQADEKPQNFTQTDCNNNPGKCWKQAFVYDRYGNRSFDEANTTTLTKACGTSPNFVVCSADRKRENPTTSANTNRLVLDQDSDGNSDYSYDSAGNTTKDAYTQQYIYDSDNKLVQAQDAGGAPLGTYYFDGTGKRIKKIVPNGETTVFVYDILGRAVAEYSTQLSQAPQVAYTTTDNLGTPRINTNAFGAVIARHDYHPFGDEISSLLRTPALGYGSDEVRKTFTGYEADAETGLDYAQARMYSNRLGRFTTPDPAMVSASIQNPQTWHRYAYVLNNPLKYFDPLGLWTVDLEVTVTPVTETKDGKTKTRMVVTVRLVLKKEDGDDVKSLAKQLNVKVEEAQKILDKMDDKGDIQVSQTDSKLAAVFSKIEERVKDHEEAKAKHPKNGDTQGWDCSKTSSWVAEYSWAVQDSGFNGLDDAVRQGPTGVARNIEDKDVTAGDIVRFAKEGRDAEHWATFLMFNKKGDPVVFSKSGKGGPNEVGTAGDISKRWGYGPPTPNPSNAGAKTPYYRKN